MLNICLKKGVRFAAYVTFWLSSMACLPVLATPSASVILDWDKSADPTVTGYNLYYGSSSRDYTNVAPAGAATTAAVSNLTAGATYYFAATTYNLAGLESDYSVEVSYNVPTNSPAILQANAASGQSRSLTISGAVGNNYQVQYCTNLATGATWYPLLTFTATNAVQTVIINPTQSVIFYRVQQR